MIFDTAPTGHTLRLLSLPERLDGIHRRQHDRHLLPRAARGPHGATLRSTRQLWPRSATARSPPSCSSAALSAPPSTRPSAPASSCAALGVDNQHLVLNGVFAATDSDDTLALALEDRQREALAVFPQGLALLPRTEVPLLSFAPLGADALTAVFEPTHMPAGGAPAPHVPGSLPAIALTLPALIDEIAEAGHGIVLTMGKGGVGKTTIAAAIAAELVRRGHTVHLSTTDPAAHVADAVDGELDGLTVSRIDPRVETAAYTAEVLATAGRDLDAQARALLEEDLRSPCTEEIAVFRAFARTVAAAEDGFVVLDTAPTGHTLLLLEAAEAYHREVSRTTGEVPDEVRQLLPRLRDPEFARVLLVTLPEATPVHEAARLGDDLRRAGIEPHAWVINQSFAETHTTDPVLVERAARELPYIQEVADQTETLAIVPWQAEPPVGAERLAALTGAM